jgi:O-antigen/teichoic acid export membrane protein
VTTPDHGASAERTRLAWRRTALSATAVALLAARPALRPAAGVAAWLVAAATMTAWVVLVALGYRRVHGLTRSPPRPGRRAITAYALITAALALLGGLVVML